jgi:beta-galactosidase
VEDYYSLQESVPIISKFFQGSSKLWAERLSPLEAANLEELARFEISNGWLDGQLAIAVNSYGNGFVYTVGTWLDDDSQQALTDEIISRLKFDLFKTPAGVEVRTRTRANAETVYFIINHQSTSQTVSIPWNAFDHLTGKTIQGDVVFGGYAVAILTRQAE